MRTDWSTWIRRIWPQLVKGKHVRVPRWLPHPSRAGFRRTNLAEPVGQVADWVISLPDESRIHVHEYENGTLRVHRDRLDPERSTGHAVNHWLSESSSGAIALGIAGMAAIGGAVWLVAKIFDEG